MISSSSLPLLLKVGVATLLSAILTINFLASHPLSQYHEAIGHAIHGPSVLEIVQTTQIDDPHDPGPLKQLCVSANWTEGIIFSCGFPSGELAEVRNTVLNCVRYAIAAGAALAIPQIYTLVEDAVAKELLSKAEPFTHYFDLPHFLTDLAESCPQMTIYPTKDDLWAFPTVSNPISLNPTTLFTSFRLDTLDAFPSQWAYNFHHWLQKTHSGFTPALPAYLRIREPFLNFPTDHDPPSFAKSFGRILQFRPDIRLLAAQIHLELSQSIPSLKAATKISDGTYLGAHLHSMPDGDRNVSASDWTSLATQASLYVEMAVARDLRTIYVTASHAGDISVIQSHTKETGIRIVSKETLLPPGVLDALSWDQRAIIDFEVLLKAAGFVGVTSSLFAWNIALRRHLVCGDDVEINATAKTGLDLGFADGCTKLFGERDDTFRWGVWP